jgi:hypothetical protein
MGFSQPGRVLRGGRLYLLAAQDGRLNGTVKQYEFYVSPDGLNWRTAVAAGNFHYGLAVLTGGGGTILGAQQVNFGAAAGQYIRFRAPRGTPGRQLQRSMYCIEWWKDTS